jgi:hypothetical protein
MICGQCGAVKNETPWFNCYGCSIKNRCIIEGDHWLWTGAKRGNYGVMRIKEGKKFALRNVHRIAFALWKGPIPAGDSVLHLKSCGYHLCCNPEHLYLKAQPLDLGDPLPEFEDVSRP